LTVIRFLKLSRSVQKRNRTDEEAAVCLYLCRIIYELPNFYRYNVPKRGKIYQIAIKSPYGHKIHQMDVEYTNLFHSKALQNLPKLVRKYTIWLPWLVNFQEGEATLKRAREV
jgi:hypothetical protein